MQLYTRLLHCSRCNEHCDNHYITQKIFSLARCDDGCVNGQCTAPDTCSCNTGWKGGDCNSGMVTFNYVFDQIFFLEVVHALKLRYINENIAMHYIAVLMKNF